MLEKMHDPKFRAEAEQIWNMCMDIYVVRMREELKASEDEIGQIILVMLSKYLAVACSLVPFSPKDALDLFVTAVEQTYKIKFQFLRPSHLERRRQRRRHGNGSHT